MGAIDVVVVSYNSAGTLRDCVAPLASAKDVNVIVVDNASRDRSLATVADLPITALALDTNRGFAYGCNRGCEAGSSPAVLFLNPDARIDLLSLRRLDAVLEADDRVGLVAPAITDEHGSVDFSLRRFPRLRSTYSRAFFLHRVFPEATWSDEVIRDRTVYRQAAAVEWVSGSCVLVRRTALDLVGGWDERFFLYGEDVDLCHRLWSAGFRVQFEPAAHALHMGGRSAPRAKLLPTLAASRLRYAKLHYSSGGFFLERLGVALGELTHAALTTKGSRTRAGHVRALRLACALDGKADRQPGVPPTVDERSTTI